jgi:hypothetical protein
MKLQAYNNWENYEWTLNEVPIDPQMVDSVLINRQKYNVRTAKRVNQVDDHGHRYTTVTYDLEIETKVEDVTVWLSLYKNPKLLSKVKQVELKESVL